LEEEEMEKPYKCVQCGAELTADEFISGGHAVPDVDGDGDVCGQYLCGPVQIDTEWATIHIASSAARIASLDAQLAAAQERERWIPASEAPPKNGPYLILFKGKVVYATFLTNGWYQWYYANRVVPDAWRELPAPPEEAADANN
jgi:hypothetical protein